MSTTNSTVTRSSQQKEPTTQPKHDANRLSCCAMASTNLLQSVHVCTCAGVLYIKGVASQTSFGRCSQVLIKQTFYLVRASYFCSSIYSRLVSVISLSVTHFSKSHSRSRSRVHEKYLNIIFYTQFVCRTRVTRQTHASRKPRCP